MSREVYAQRGPAKRGMWRGYRCLKFGTDLMLYAEMIRELKPDFIIETGTRFGGSALFFSDICELEGHGQVVTVEISTDYTPPCHPRMRKIIGNSVCEAVIHQISELVRGKRVMVVLDSDHSPAHVARELELYSKFLQLGDYIIVEDAHQAGAIGSVREFLRLRKGLFTRDKDIEKYGIHCGRDGFIRRIA